MSAQLGLRQAGPCLVRLPQQIASGEIQVDAGYGAPLLERSATPIVRA
jgi:hypothetical protein